MGNGANLGFVAPAVKAQATLHVDTWFIAPERPLVPARRVNVDMPAFQSVRNVFLVPAQDWITIRPWGWIHGEQCVCVCVCEILQACILWTSIPHNLDKGCLHDESVFGFKAAHEAVHDITMQAITRLHEAMLKAKLGKASN